MRLVFVGAVEGSYKGLEALLEAGGSVVHIYSLDLKYAPRHSDFANLQPLADRFDVPLTRVNNINQPQVVASIRNSDPEYLLVAIGF